MSLPMHIKKSALMYPRPNAALCAPVKALGNVSEIIYSRGSSSHRVLLEVLSPERMTWVYVLKTKMLMLYSSVGNYRIYPI